MMKPEANMFNPPKPLILDEDSNASYKKFKQKFDIYMKATKYDMENDDRKIAIFLMVGGDVAIEIFNALELTEEQKQNYQSVITAFDNHFMPKTNELLSRYLFNTRKQLKGEMLKDFISDLKYLAEQCNFGDQKDLLIRDQIIVGIINDPLRHNLLDLRSSTLLQIENICYASELNKIQVKQEVDVEVVVIKKEESVNEETGFSHATPMNIECTPEFIETHRQEPNQLPEGLPPNVLKLINDFKSAGENFKGDGKKAFFTDEINSCLLSLRKELKQLNKSFGPKVYEYLSQYANCSKETLIRRSKMLVQSREENKLKNLKEELKRLIATQMPDLIMKYQQKCDAVLKQKFAKDKEDGQIKTIRTPRRCFPLTDMLRNLIKDIWNTKKECLLLDGKQKDVDELVSQYIRNEILPLWPDGWMYLNTLKKICENKIEKPGAVNSDITMNTTTGHS